MADVIATLFRFRQFVFEYGPFFLAAWFAVALATGLVMLPPRKVNGPKMPGSPLLSHQRRHWIRQFLLLPTGQSGEKLAEPTAFSGLLAFSLAASVPGLVATSLIDMKTLGLRVFLAVLYALFLHWSVNRITLLKIKKRQLPPAEEPEIELRAHSPEERSHSGRTFSRAAWKTFIGQMEKAMIPLAIGFSLASVLTVYVPVYTLRPWLGLMPGPYLVVLLAIPFQLTGGAEVPLASALLVKGASLGTALSVMLAAPVTNLGLIRHLHRNLSGKVIVLYLAVAWLGASSLGAAVDLAQRFLIVG